MKANLRHLISPDIDERVFWPDEEDCFCFAVDALVGPDGEPGEEAFGFRVCTPKWIATRMINRDFVDFGVFGKNLIIVKEYDWDAIRKMVATLCANTTGKDWQEVASKLSRFGRWEFEDHQG